MLTTTPRARTAPHRTAYGLRGDRADLVAATCWLVASMWSGASTMAQGGGVAGVVIAMAPLLWCAAQAAHAQRHPEGPLLTHPTRCAWGLALTMSAQSAWLIAQAREVHSAAALVVLGYGLAYGRQPGASRRVLALGVACALAPLVGAALRGRAGVATLLWYVIEVGGSVAITWAYTRWLSRLDAPAEVPGGLPPEPPKHPANAPAAQLGSYRLIKKLGEGGMGEVWRAEHELLKRPAAVKIIRRDLLPDEEDHRRSAALIRFAREARVTAQLTSTHTVRVYDFGMTERGEIFYAMELLDGVDLETLIQRFGPQPQERVRAWLLQMCDSLAEAHAAGLVHRDIKPANFFLCRQGYTYGVVKLLDFGLVTAPLADDAGEEGARPQHITVQGALAGTPAYMAPEQIRGVSTLDHRADLYALACVAYYALTGRDVFEAASAPELLVQHLNAAPIAPRQRVGGLQLSAAFEAALMRCLSKDPEQRPQSAEALSQLVRACQMDRIWSHEAERLWAEQHLGVPPRVAADAAPDRPTAPMPPPPQLMRLEPVADAPDEAGSTHEAPPTMRFLRRIPFGLNETTSEGELAPSSAPFYEPR